MQLLEKYDIKWTRARKRLFEIFQTASKPLCYDELKDDISMDKATFYRNILVFEKEGILHSFESVDKKRYFEMSSNPHAHFICKVCNCIECITNLPQYTIEGCEVDDIVICGKCSHCLHK